MTVIKIYEFEEKKCFFFILLICLNDFKNSNKKSSSIQFWSSVFVLLPGLLPELCENPLQVRGQPQLFLQVKKAVEPFLITVLWIGIGSGSDFHLLPIRIRILPPVLHMLEIFRAVPAYFIFLISVKGVMISIFLYSTLFVLNFWAKV